MNTRLSIAWRYNLLVLAVVLALNGCAFFTANTSQEALLDRLTQVWQSKKLGAWGNIYEFSMAQFNPDKSRDDFVRGGGLNVESFEIKEIVELVDSQRSVVRVCFTTQQMGLSLKGVCINERWVVHNGKWYLDDNISQSPF